jgi:6-phosphogluconolactonase (cycloisomerase 2 family)
LSGATDYTVPVGSAQPYAVAFSQDSTSLITANLATDDITLFTLDGAGAVTNAVSYPLPIISGGPDSVAISPNNAHIAVGAQNSNDVVIYEDACLKSSPFIGAASMRSNPISMCKQLLI